ncbi:FUSC family protein [Pseudokineococcus sp. 1T1Z-3]|uniref:FUSC family protein n=1 Tax=Pseudokineococcus sp. 1T1Z-3 TaxID=3132745 RepID=UPI0030AD1504
MDLAWQARRVGRALRHPRHLLRQLGIGRWPRVEMALKAAMSAFLAWQLASLLPLPAAERYAYYAPLGAVVASYPSVASSVSQSLRSVLGIIAGGLLALSAEALVPGQTALVPLVVALGILLAGLPVFGEQHSWVPMAALFVLVVGADEPVVYALAYSGLVLLGAAVAVVVTLLLPTVPLAQTTRAMQRLATTLADQLDDLAGGLLVDDPPSSSQWRERSRAVEPVLASVRASGLDVRRSLRANARAHRERGVVERQRGEALVLDAVATRVGDLTDLLLDVHATGRTQVDLADRLRDPTARVLHAAAATIRPLAQEDHPRPEEVAATREALQHLSTVLDAQEGMRPRSREAAGAVVTALRRLLGALTSASEDEHTRREDADVLEPS